MKNGRTKHMSFGAYPSTRLKINDHEFWIIWKRRWLSWAFVVMTVLMIGALGNLVGELFRA